MPRRTADSTSSVYKRDSTVVTYWNRPGKICSIGLEEELALYTWVPDIRSWCYDSEPSRRFAVSFAPEINIHTFYTKLQRLQWFSRLKTTGKRLNNVHRKKEKRKRTVGNNNQQVNHCPPANAVIRYFPFPNYANIPLSFSRGRL